MTDLEVWGDPIGHSRSPELHLAAYRALGLDWRFARREVSADGFDEALGVSSVRGLALTYPLKDLAFRAATARDRRAELTGAVNTLFFPDGRRAVGFNTDVGGIATALREAGVAGAATVRILGSGATATSALVALGELGAERVEIAARRPARAAELVALGERLGVDVRATDMTGARTAVDLTVATLPGGTTLEGPVASALAATGGDLFDVAYSPWPSALAAFWTGPVHHGLGMLLHQAVLQVRVFTSGDVEAPLPDEPRVIQAMTDALGRGARSAS